MCVCGGRTSNSTEALFQSMRGNTKSIDRYNQSIHCANIFCRVLLAKTRLMIPEECISLQKQKGKSDKMLFFYVEGLTSDGFFFVFVFFFGC